MGDWGGKIKAIIFNGQNVEEQEVEEFRKLHREKSFDEARTAVQSQVH